MGHPQTKVSKLAVEAAGRNWFTAQLLLRGLEVSVPIVDLGIDLIVFKEVGDAGIRALPLQLKCASAESFGIDRKYAGRGIPMVYVWNVLDQPTAFLLTYEEALAALGPAAETSSWRDGGRYTKSYIPKLLRERLLPYQDRWEWLNDRLDSQPTSGG